MKNDTRLMEWSGMETPGREPRKGMRRACQGRKEARPRRRHPTVLSQEWITRHCSPIPRSRAHTRCLLRSFLLSMILSLCEISDGTFHMDLEGRKTSNPFVLSSPFRSFQATSFRFILLYIIYDRVEQRLLYLSEKPQYSQSKKEASRENEYLFPKP